MKLLDCYLPVFKQVLYIIENPKDFTSYEPVREQCTLILEQSISCANSLEYINIEEKELARFAVIAWIDEILLRASLPWQKYWQTELLQRKYLNTSIAGQLFFTFLAQLTPNQHSVRCIFLFCLQNDFRGKYNTQETQSVLLDIILRQRKLLLNEDWLLWPNDTEITPCIIETKLRNSVKQSLLPIFTVITLLLYTLIFLLLSFYVD
ncbi:DotU family type IV/VI secretion system protein [Providencia rettgeri]|uniref:DotU family type IV/VI secretion system protein n=1 Tax=Providencia rettgeri TaxID=587 RepID=UPI00141986B6|nr:DotU family type IV/VI secretion system protein [Providencia rettgeri]NIH07155.1 DotU family type IV/VI secretion system protein [Providencia rettgeri]